MVKLLAYAFKRPLHINANYDSRACWPVMSLWSFELNTRNCMDGLASEMQRIIQVH
jgi:hypothetical protein